MTLDQRKQELASWILGISNESIISQLELIQKEMGDWHEKLPKEIQDALTRSENQIKEGKVISHEDVMKKLDGRT